MIKPQHADVFEALDSHLKLRLLRSQTKKQLKDLKEGDFG